MLIVCLVNPPFDKITLKNPFNKKQTYSLQFKISKASSKFQMNTKQNFPKGGKNQNQVNEILERKSKSNQK